jgi:hypothetical protein
MLARELSTLTEAEVVARVELQRLEHAVTFGTKADELAEAGGLLARACAHVLAVSESARLGRNLETLPARLLAAMQLQSAALAKVSGVASTAEHSRVRLEATERAALVRLEELQLAELEKVKDDLNRARTRPTEDELAREASTLIPEPVPADESPQVVS